jgi:hypothetical protein
LASTFGVAIIPDTGRWIAQSVAAVPERAAMKQAIAEAVHARRQLSGVDRPENETAAVRQERLMENHLKRRGEMVAQINASRRLKPAQKAVLLSRLEAAITRFDATGSTLNAEAQTQIDRGIHVALDKAQEDAYAILDTHIVSKVSGAKVAREAVNTAAVVGSSAALLTGAGTMFAGIHFLRGPAYAAQAYLERYSNTSKSYAIGERETKAGPLTVMKEGFTEWWSKLAARESNIKDRRQAIATLMRSTGFGLTSAVAGGALAIEGATSIDFDEILDNAYAGVKAMASEAYAKVFSDELASSSQSYLGGAAEAEAPYVPEAEPVRGVPFKGEIPVGSRIEELLRSKDALVGDQEGITQVLKRVIKNNPEAYGYDGDSDISEELFAKRMAMRITESEGQMNRWLTTKAVDKLNLFPEFVDGSWQISGVVDGKKLSIEELAELGYTDKEPVKSR